jgi:hypothetical protein
MDYQAFTNDSLTMMYEAVRAALASDDATKAQGGKPDSPSTAAVSASLDRYCDGRDG